MSDTRDDSTDDSTDDTTDDTTEWYWDLERNMAVPADERGRGDHMLGPYRTKGEAENWRTTVEARNDAWDEADDEWERRGAEPGDD